jgi:glutamate dehydrogenase (NADP) (EC 1.4.1.4)
MRFHPSVNLSILKFLGFEQTFKNALTTLPMGGGKGGSDFDPKGKSEGEVMRFCQALVTELYRHLGPDTDVPAGDIGVGGREVGFMAGMMKKLSNNSACVFTGKGLSFGGSLIRPEATGYGLVYFTEAMLKRHGLSFEGMRVAVSGSGNVAQYAIEKAMAFGARVVTASDSSGTVVDEAGFTAEKLARMCEIKASRDGRVADYAREFGLTYLEGKQPWGVPVDIALPCATQNELDVDAARTLISNGVKAVAKGQICPPLLKRPTCSWTRACCLRQARRRTLAAWQHPVWKWRKTPREWAGRQRKWMPVCTTSCSIFITPAWSTAARPRKLTTCAGRISPGS